MDQHPQTPGALRTTVKLLGRRGITRALLLLGSPLHSSASASSTSAAAASASSTPPATATAASTSTAATEAPTSTTTPTPAPSSASAATTAAPTTSSSSLAPLALAEAAPLTRSRRSADRLGANKPGGAESGGESPEGSETSFTRSPWSSRLCPRVPLTSQQLHEWYGRRRHRASAPQGSTAGGSSAGVAGPGGARTGGTRAAGAGGVVTEGTGATEGAGAAGGTGDAGGAGGAGAAEGTGAVGGAGPAEGPGATGGAGSAEGTGATGGAGAASAAWGGGGFSCTYVIRTGDRTGQPCGGPHATQRCFAHLNDAWHVQFPQATELPRWVDLLKKGIDIYALDFDAILTAMYVMSTSGEGAEYLCVPPDPGIRTSASAAPGTRVSATPGTGEAAALGACASAPPGTESTAALHTFTLDSGASRCFFRDRTALEPLARPVAVSLADPSGGPVIATSSTVIPCPAVPSGTLSGLHLPSFSTNLVAGCALQDGGVHLFTPAYERVTHCTCARTGRHLATFTRQPGSDLYTLTTGSPQVTLLCPVCLASHQLPRRKVMPEPLFCTYVDAVPPPGANIVSGMWIFRVKRPPGSPSDFKARYVARGFSQRHGVDYFQTFSPTPKMTTLRVLLHVAAHRDYELHSLDFSTAFLQGSLHEEIWLCRPLGFTGTFPPSTQWSLRWPVYGLRQAPREWHDTLRTTLAALGFAPSTADPSLFLRTDTSLPPFYILVYVDDLVFATADTAGLAYVKSELQKRHTCTDLGELRSYLGLQITRDRALRTITLTQSHMVQQVLQRFGFTYSSPQATPLPTRHSLSALPSDESVDSSGPYPELVGCLMYLMTCTRPDLAYPLSILARYVDPGRHRPEHMAAAKRVLRYLCSTSGMGLVLGGRSPVVLTGHADASWADDQATQRSSHGYSFSLGSGSVSWRATRSSSVLGSSCEAEIYAGAMAAQELRWLTYLLTDLGEPPRSPLVLYVDNKVMLALCREHRLEHRTKHIALRYFLARELHQRGQLRLAYVASEANTADVFTKALAPSDHQRFCTQLGLSVYPPSVGGECALGTDVLEDRQEDLECLAATAPHLVAMLLAPEGDPDAPDIPTPRSYAEAITGSPSVFKARYMARSFSQRDGVEFFQTFSPTLKMTTLWVLLHVAAQRDYELHSLDFSTAFLQGSLHKEIWLRRPPGFTGSFPPGTQWSLRRPVYGLRQAPHEWHDTLRTTLAALGFAPSTADMSLFLRTDTSLSPFYILVYVDDLVFATADTEALALVKSELQKRHTCTDLGELRNYLGLQITQDRARRTITLTQSHMVQQALQCFGFTWSSAQATPLATGHSLSAPPSDESVEPSGLYPELVGCLMYLMTCTRPDLAYPLSLLARYVAPGRHHKVHWDAAKRVLRYLCSTSGMRLVLGGRARVVLTGHADASWVDDLATQRSSQGYTFSLGSDSVSWRSTRSSSILSSSCEAEIYARAMAAQELRWLTYLLTDLGEAPRSPPVLYVDNKAAIALC
ncbi:unnamed protein product [Closterium sp. NIES-54]